MINKNFAAIIICLILASTKLVCAQEEKVEMTEEPQKLSPPSAEVVKANGPILTEEELLTPKPKPPPPKEDPNKINEAEIYVQDAEKLKIAETYKTLNLNDVIEQGLRKNYDQLLRDQQKTFNDVDFSGVKRAFWLPELKLTLTTTDQHITTIHSADNASNVYTPNTPSGSLGLSLGNYTIFNWGKDYALYLNNKESYERNQQILEETRREFRLDLIAQYFALLSAKNIDKINQDQLRQAAFIYRLNKERVAVGKVSKQDYYLARSEYLRSQNEYHLSKETSDTLDESMSFTISDDIGTKYTIIEALDYKRLKVSLEACFEYAAKNNAGILNSKSALENAERAHDIAVRENLPLPKFTVNLGAYTKQFGPTTNQTAYSNSYNGNVEVVASVNATWSLTGADGLFNSDKLAKSRISQEISFRELSKNDHLARSLIRQTYSNILSEQNQLLILESRIPTLQKTFDTILENYLANKIKFYDFHLILTEITQAKILLEQTKLQHLKDKLTLAKLSGIEDFPGENFDKIAVLKKEIN